MQSRKPRVAIVGVGGVGGVISACLETAGRAELTLLARGSCLDRIQRPGGGMLVRRHDGMLISCQPRVEDVRNAAAVGEQDFVLWATKAHQMRESAATVAALLGPRTRVVPLQNGLPYWFMHGFGGALEGETLTESDATAWHAVCPSRVIGCMHYVAGEVRHDGEAYSSWISKWPAEKASLTFGEIAAHPAPSESSASDSVVRLASLFDSPQLPLRTHVVGHGAIRRAVLEKAKVNATINTLCALTQSDCGELTASASLRDALRRICAEVDAIAAALTPPLEVSRGGEYILDKYAGQFGLLPSMVQDLRARRSLEREALVSSLVALGARLGVATPNLELVDALLEGLDMERARGSPE